MITDPSIREQAYQYFLEEAPALLETVEAEIFSLQQDQELSQRKLTVNNLMRAVHTLKGGAANVGLETIKTIAHSFEDLLKALYSPDLEIDNSLQSLLFDSYECLRLPLTAEFSQTSIDDQGILEQANSVFVLL
ncbi:MAG: hypothetical protein D6756_09920 [Cyanobacteria bacterium J083]|nr:MAG: hypothetical protein D6756_09920 [Cyanobacteria bacterium J083]